MNPDMIARADELIAAHNEAREQRGKTMTDQSETERQADRMVSQLASWVKQQAVAATSAQRLIADQQELIDRQRAELDRQSRILHACYTELDDGTVDGMPETIREVMETAKIHYSNYLQAVKERDALIADNAAIKAHHDDLAAELVKARIDRDRYGAEYTKAVRVLGRADRQCGNTEEDRNTWQRRARTWKRVAKRFRRRTQELRHWRDEYYADLTDAQQRIADIKATVRDISSLFRRFTDYVAPLFDDRLATEINGLLDSIESGDNCRSILVGRSWRKTGEQAYDLVRDGTIIARVRRVTPSAWYYATNSTTSEPDYVTADEAMRAAEAALGVEVTR